MKKWGSWRARLGLVAQEPVLEQIKLPWRAVEYGLAKYLGQQDFVERRINGKRMQLPVREPGIAQTLFLFGAREKEHQYLLEKILKSGDAVLDLGANIGYYVLLESNLLGHDGRIIAVEPSPENFMWLKRNVEINKLKNVDLKQAAVADQDGEVELHISELSNVHSLLANARRRQTGEVINVPAVSLGTLLKDYGHIDLVRMDIEGYEQVLFESLIRLNERIRFLPKILFELHGKDYDREKFSQVLAKMFEMGYKVSYFASADRDLLESVGLDVEKSIPTDGRVRHIVRNVSLNDLMKVVWTGRCMVFQV